MKKLAFNDMLGKGFDSARQESFCWQRYTEGDPQFWWVSDVYNRHGHAWDWDKHQRDQGGRFKKFPAGKEEAASSHLLRTITAIDKYESMVSGLSKVAAKLGRQDRVSSRIVRATIRNIIKAGIEQ